MLPMDGWIKLHRSMLSWEWWDDARMVKSFLTILLMANSEDNRWHGQVVKAGSFITSRAKLATALRLSEKQTRLVLSRLSMTGEISVRTNNHFTMITVNNWTNYQERKPSKKGQPEVAETQNDNDFFEGMKSDRRPTEGQPEDKQKADKGPTKGHKQEDREGEKNIYTGETKRKNFVRPTLEEIKAYCQETGLSIDAEYFFDYYNSNGWKIGSSPMKDWQATARNWNRREKEKSKQTENHGGIIHEYKFRPDESGTKKLDWEMP